MTKNEGKYALVTGGTSGIGYELAKLLADDGYNLVIVARSEDDLQRVSADLRSQFGVEVLTMSKDLFERENAFAIGEELKAKNIEIDILVNDAGHGQYGEFVETDIWKELKIIDLNISSLVILTKIYLQEMVARGSGKILNVSSIASKIPGPWQSVYHGTKAFVQSFTEAVRSEVKDTGVTVTALLPGPTATAFFEKADMTESKIVKEGKLYDAADVARDGYEALMSGDDMVVSGLKNKLQVAMSSVTPDAKLADKMKEKQEPVGKRKRLSDRIYGNDDKPYSG
ncbi:MAG TPA: SDR family oxidoreductase [Chryseolinea sp.]